MDLSNVCAVFLSVFMIYGQCYSYGNIKSLADDSIQRRINEFREYCPYTNLCNTSAQEILQSSTSSWQTSCCKSCDCGSDCGLDCCPDRSAHFESEEEMYYIKNVIQCVPLQYSPYSVWSFLMVSRCPYGYSDFEIAAKCAREYSCETSLLDVPLRYILPGYDNFTRLIYKNSFCARCHNVQENTLDFFSFKLYWVSDTQINNTVNYKAQCEITLSPPFILLPLFHLKCDHEIIRRCNVTGQWEVYDKYLEEACLSYTSVYENFRNVHCFLCNGFNASDIRTSCGHSYKVTTEIPEQTKEPLNILTLLDWAQDVIPDQVDERAEENVLPIVIDCLQSIILNVSRADEWFTFCPDGMVVLNNTCTFPYLVLPSDIVMEINLILEPKFVSEGKFDYTINQILSDVLKEIQNLMTLLPSRDLQHYKVTGFVSFNKYINNLHEGRNEVHMESVDSVALKIQIFKYMSKMDHVETTFEDIAQVLTNISDFGNFNARLYHIGIPFLDIRKLLPCPFDLEQQEYTLLCYNSEQYINEKLYFDIFRSNFYRFVNLSDYSIAAEPEPFCPRVALPKPFLCNESLVKNNYSENFLNRKLSENKTHLFFCYQDYAQHLDSLNVKPNEQEPTPVASDRVQFYLTIACLIPSLICLVLTLTVYSFYPILRTLPGLNNMALVCSLILFQTMALVNTVFRIDVLWVCGFVGIFTHFSLMLSFAWMFVCTFHMLNVFVKIRNQTVARNVNRTFLSYIAFTVGVAAAYVIIAVVVAMVHSGGSDIGYGGNSCYIKKPIMIILVVAVPVAMVTLMNIVMFGVVVFKVKKLPVLASSNIQERNNIKICVKLSTITGMTWIFGFLYIFTRLQAFAYIFIVFNAGQGVFIMLSFICNRRVLNLVMKKSTKPSTRRMKRTPL